MRVSELNEFGYLWQFAALAVFFFFFCGRSFLFSLPGSCFSPQTRASELLRGGFGEKWTVFPLRGLCGEGDYKREDERQSGR